jgi:hypothetical protein
MRREVGFESSSEITVGAFVCFFGSVDELVPGKVAFACTTEIAFVAFVGLFSRMGSQMFVKTVLALSNVRAMRALESALISHVRFGHFAVM